MQYLLIPRYKWKICFKIIENSQIGMSEYLDTSTKTQMAQIMVQYGRPSCSSWTDSVTTLWERQFEKVLLEHDWEKFLTGNVFSSTEKKDYSCLCMWKI